MLEVTGGDPTVTVIGLLWLSGIVSAIVDNIPYTATMIPLVIDLGRQGIPIEPAWWALALGADLGGNATIVGASANVVVASLAFVQATRSASGHSCATASSSRSCRS